MHTPWPVRCAWWQVGIFQQAAETWAERQVGRELRVLVDRMDGDDAIGRTEADAPDIDGLIRLPGVELAPGTELVVTIVAADVMELVGTPSTKPGAVSFFSAPSAADDVDEA